MEMIRAILPQLSLLVLIMVIAVGFVKKINIGFFSIGMLPFYWHCWEWR